MPEDEKTNEPDKNANTEVAPQGGEGAKSSPPVADNGDEKGSEGVDSQISALNSEIATLKGTIDAMSARMGDMDRAFRTGGPTPRPPEPPKSVSIEDLFE